MTEYQRLNLQRRELQIKYSSMYYTLPDTYEEKNEVYSKAFNTGKGFIIGYATFLYRTHGLEGDILIGNNVTIGDHVTIDYSGGVVIKDGVVISEGVRIFSHDHDAYRYTHKMDNNTIPKRTVIKDNAWIGAGSIVLPGVTIGEYGVVGAGLVVTHDVPAHFIFAGNPARKIGEVS